ncbi:MAG TPA: MarP family serine protease [Mycobacteriales bacterium]|nr:MarP family serine protease [Mycobacteriales bacterium]
MDGLDVVLIVVCIGFAISGYRQGFIIGFLSFVGFIGGGVLGARYASDLHSHFSLGLDAAFYGLLVVLLGAMVGQLLATLLGAALRREMTWRPLRMADSLAGGVVSVLSVLLVAWLLGAAIANTSAGGVSREVRNSSVLEGVDKLVPSVANTWFASFRRLLDQDLDRNGFPPVFGGIGSIDVAPVSPPDPKLAHSRAVVDAQPDVVKVTGIADSCSRALEGSGFLYGPNRVMTNAHVVAGVGSPKVITADGRQLSATVVLYDPERDVAVLDVPGLNGTPLSFAGPVGRGKSAIVLGYPENGPFTARAARVRGVQDARGPDIYQDREVTRQIYSLYSTVLPGNSGGPLITPAGRVAGVVFAAAVGDPRTGYALTAHEVAPDAVSGLRAHTQVSTEGCD